MSDFVTLTCPNCSGRLEITDDIDRFACMYCGSEHIVRRGGGIVTLQPVVDELKKVSTGISGVKVGVDRTASELAIQRLQGELAELDRRQKSLVATLMAIGPEPRPSLASLAVLVVKSCILWFVLLIVTIALVASATENGFIICASILLVPTAFTYLYFTERNKARLAHFHQFADQYERTEQQIEALENEMTHLRRELARHRELVRQIDN